MSCNVSRRLEKKRNFGAYPGFHTRIDRMFASTDGNQTTAASSPLQDAASFKSLVRMFADSAMGRRTVDAKIRQMRTRNLREAPKLSVFFLRTP